MKIAVFFELNGSQIGGAFSFNKTIFENLSKNRSLIQHELLYIFSKQNVLNVQPDIPLPGKFQYRLSYLASILRQVFNWNILKSGINLESCRSAYLDRLLVKHRVDAVWAVQPLGVPVNRPFFTTSWDIAHKITPYFPEVSDKGKLLKKRDKVASKVFSRAMRIIVGTEVGKREIEFAYGVNSERIIVNPLPVKKVSMQSLKQNDSLKLIYPANFWAHKNHAVLIEALRMVIDRTGMQLQLFLTGSDRGSQGMISNLVKKLELENSVNFVGFLSEIDLDELYKECSLLVFPSLIGPDNLPPLEALTFGCKIAVADIPGAREQFGKFATYFDPYNVSEIARAIELSITENGSSFNQREIYDFLMLRDCDHYINFILKEFDKFEHIMEYIE
jgi:glycosyltransferase involved in cell wall biosynthesis